MPGFTSHYLFGVQMYHQLSDPTIKLLIKQNLGPFRFGLQGPDLFFYNPFHIFYSEDRNIGKIMHETKVNLFFRNYLFYAEKLNNPLDRDTAMSYFYGFVCHYTLDTILHPYVYYRSGYRPDGVKGKKESFSMHTYIEALMDTILLKEQFGLTPSKFHQTRTLSLSWREYHLLSHLLVKSINKTYFATKETDLSKKLVKRFSLLLSISSIKFGTWFLHDKTGLKKKLIRIIEKYWIKEVVVAHIISSDKDIDHIDANNLLKIQWFNPWDKTITSTKSVPEMMIDAGLQFMEYEHVLNNYTNALLYDKNSRKDKKEILLNKLGNLSYHSGLSCE